MISPDNKYMTPWQMQDQLMDISDQDRPKKYEVNNTSILYAALILEEVSELLLGLEKVLTRINKEEYDVLFDIISGASRANEELSLEIRNELKMLGEFRYSIDLVETQELADATTDITVVNCGFAVASGIDGSACYTNVAESNLSKANPVTGIIDKDPSGKWIKGANYQVPNLAQVLFK